MTFSFADLFAGIGGFHAALGALGGECWFASEIDLAAKRVYQHNWHTDAADDIVPLTTDRMDVPPHDVLAAGFPCQPFSKSGFQHGMREARGTLFWNICRVLEERRPTVVLLENVRNLAGPRHAHEWKVIVEALRDLGYRVSGTPAVFSPHLLPPGLGGRPQVRERVFIVGTYVGRRRAWRDTGVEPIVTPRPVEGWNPLHWDLERDLPLDDDQEIPDLDRYRLSEAEQTWVSVWDDLVVRLRERLGAERLPGFPIWADEFVHPDDLRIPRNTPSWKADFLRKNAQFYARHQDIIDDWFERHDGLAALPASRRKLEWQAQETRSLWDSVMHFRPSGIRAKRSTYLPALVAITQTSVIGSRRRRITPREAARLQGLPDWFEFKHDLGDLTLQQPDPATYKQLGNGVSVGAAHYVFRQHVLRDIDDIGERAPGVAEAVLAGDPNVDNPLRDRLEPRPLSVGPEGSGGRTIIAPSREPELSVG